MSLLMRPDFIVEDNFDSIPDDADDRMDVDSAARALDEDSSENEHRAVSRKRKRRARAVDSSDDDA